MQRQAVIRIAACALVAAVALVAVATSAAKPKAPLDLRNARYCEILELQGAIPDAHVEVWNTIGLNECPAAQWDAFDAGSLATELGASAVILNGPRYFLMDTAKAKIGETKSFHGMEMRHVATIPITTPADLGRAPYTERTIDRINTWRWDEGSRIYELLAPGGARYVMQSYSQILDPAQTIGDLKTLGERLTLPEGWRYRTRRLNKPLALGAKGAATIVQDDLTNTYQRAPDRKSG
jgi:hypothetical protein